ncbi:MULTISPECIES: helix-turn-helix domain-containing protein [unclassified Chryseobacterium]|uniref:helix-turn-helix domain-containing protein n=1 Tax=unclassified Chryseobacterium TaxID=2593645 RepID=UPI000D3AB8A7|nr:MULTISPECIES: helix-turn-helix domain-containing protein [unclassified Chryseobacterium]PTT72591.1 DNA-binding protein [Chryseobacterium sp. HMWF001]PVV50412.1 DNA-binding protein [Chryseobacterium sp. HMWF035]
MKTNDFFDPDDLVYLKMDSVTFYNIVKQVYERLKQEDLKQANSDFISEKETMKLLGISSKTTLQKYRDHSYITFYKLSGRKILYSRSSIERYIINNKESFD